MNPFDLILELANCTVNSLDLPNTVATSHLWLYKFKFN